VLNTNLIKILIASIILTTFTVQAEYKRSYKAKSQFKQLHPCPATGRSKGSCPGYIIDHITALKRGGADDASNMQWQTVEHAKLKDKWE